MKLKRKCSITHITLNVNGIEESESVKLVFMHISM